MPRSEAQKTADDAADAKWWVASSWDPAIAKIDANLNDEEIADLEGSYAKYVGTDVTEDTEGTEIGWDGSW